MSRTFSTSWGSLESLKVSARCGCRPKACQIRSTLVSLRPLLPTGGLGGVFLGAQDYSLGAPALQGLNLFRGSDGAPHFLSQFRKAGPWLRAQAAGAPGPAVAVTASPIFTRPRTRCARH